MGGYLSHPGGANKPRRETTAGPGSTSKRDENNGQPAQVSLSQTQGS